MASEIANRFEEDLSVKIFYELMTKKIHNILLVSSPYDAFIMEEDGKLAERIIYEYRGLNLSQPPMIKWVSTGAEALEKLKTDKFDLVITMPRLNDMEPYVLCQKIKTRYFNLSVFFLSNETANLIIKSKYAQSAFIDRIFIWRGNSDLLLALVKSAEDRMNVIADTQKAQVKVIIFVEDSPVYLSSLLPFLYKEIVIQTQSVMDESINAEHRILRMRARPKILIADNYEEAEYLYHRFKKYVLCVISDIRFPKNNVLNENAGFSFHAMIEKETPNLPVLLLSNEEKNRARAEQNQIFFLYKHSSTLHADIRYFFMERLGFGDFVFRMPNGNVVARASNLRTMSNILHSVPNESIGYHAKRDDFQRWMIARFEMRLAKEFQNVNYNDFKNEQEIKNYIINSIRQTLMNRQRGVIADFKDNEFDINSDFIKIGKGSLGGKARGLAFISNFLKQYDFFDNKFKNIEINVPKTLVIATEGFDSFITMNNLHCFNPEEKADIEIQQMFLNCSFPAWLKKALILFLKQIKYPLAVRSSSLLEDGYFRPCAGAYKTYMIPNNHRDIKVRLSHLIYVIKLVYASTFLEIPRAFSKNTLYNPEEDKMAVIIQEVTGTRNKEYFYPAISGVAQSHNFYPVSYMKPEEGIAFLALGLGKTVVEGGKALRFSPKYPQLLPQFSKIEDILTNSQQRFYALKLRGFPEVITSPSDIELIQLDIDEALEHHCVQYLSSTYLPEDHKIRDNFNPSGFSVLTFAMILKYNAFPIDKVLLELLDIGKKGMGVPVEMEFAFNLPLKDSNIAKFSLLQIRPMVMCQNNIDVEIDQKEIKQAFCYTENTMGGGQITQIKDIILVKPDKFDPAKTVQIASEIGKINGILQQDNDKYVLIGPGRWGTADRWLGIPVTWSDISKVGTIIETTHEKLNADHSQGSHFFHNITSLGINYLTITANSNDFINLEWLCEHKFVTETEFVRHIHFDIPLLMKIDGRKSCAIIK